MRIGIKENRQLILGTLMLLFLAGILLIRSFYSFSWSDESLYMAEVHRLYLGERPFVDEWHPTQFYAPLLLPLYRIYVDIKGSTEGIYLWARIFNLVLAFLAAEISYYVLKRYFSLENWLSIAGGAMVILYSRANVGGLSYHNFFFFCFTIATMMLYIGVSCYRAKKVWYQYVAISCVSGLFGGVAIIAVPTCALGIGIIYVGLMIYAVKTRTIRKFIPAWAHIAGVALIGMTYVLFIFSKITIADFWNVFPYLFMDDSHQWKVVEVFKNIWWVISFYGKNIFVVIVLLCIIKLILAFFHKNIGEQLKAVAYMLVVTVCMCDLYRLSDSHMSTYVILSLAGIGWLFLDGGTAKLKAFIESDVNVFLFIPAMVIILTFLLASATIDPTYGGGVYVSLINLIAASKFIRTFSRYECKTVVNCATTVCLMVMLGMVLYGRVDTVYRDAPLEMLDTKITKGPAKGLRTTKEHVEQYNACLEVMDYVNSFESCGEDCMLVSVLAPWMYVCTDVHNGGISPWRIYLNEPLMEEYYQYHNIENLKYVIVLNEDIGGYIGAGNPEGTSHTPNENNYEGFLYDYLRDNPYVKVEFECGTLYVRREIGKSD